MSDLKNTLEITISNFKKDLRQSKVNLLALLTSLITSFGVSVSTRFFAVTEKGSKEIKGYVLKLAIGVNGDVNLDSVNFETEKDDEKKGQIRIFYITFDLNFNVISVKNSAYYVPIFVAEKFAKIVTSVMELTLSTDYTLEQTFVLDANKGILETSKELALIGRKFEDYIYFVDYFGTDNKRVWQKGLNRLNTSQCAEICNKILIDTENLTVLADKKDAILDRMFNAEQA